ncbi:MAG TPA: hypothetical protein VJ552_07960, partial [Sediminibacterium sp.]|nr:hypothetical protein [Sediminibacterium sp.]
ILASLFFYAIQIISGGFLNFPHIPILGNFKRMIILILLELVIDTGDHLRFQNGEEEQSAC